MKFFKIENNENLQANLFSFAVHLALFLIMIFSVGWQTKTPNYAEVDVWDSVPVQKKIKKIFLSIINPPQHPQKKRLVLFLTLQPPPPRGGGGARRRRPVNGAWSVRARRRARARGRQRASSCGRRQSRQRGRSCSRCTARRWRRARPA